MPNSKFAVIWRCKMSLEEGLGLDWRTISVELENGVPGVHGLSEG